MSLTLRPQDIIRAAQLLAEARRSRIPLKALPPELTPRVFLDAEAIQTATTAELGETVVAYKVNRREPVQSMWAGIFASAFFEGHAQVSATAMAPCGIEAEVAFRLDRDIAAGDRDWTASRLDEVVTALPAIELVASRFQSIPDTPAEMKNADFLSNGGLICGAPVPGWRAIDLTTLPARVTIAGAVVAETVGGHGAGDPRIPVLAFLNAPHRTVNLKRGQVLTAGSLTGMTFAKAGDRVEADLGPLGSISLDFLP